MQSGIKLYIIDYNYIIAITGDKDVLSVQFFQKLRNWIVDSQVTFTFPTIENCQMFLCFVTLSQNLMDEYSIQTEYCVTLLSLYSGH